MRKFLILFIALLAYNNIYSQGNSNSYTVELARTFSKDIFDLNGVPYLSPMVETVNATSNSRFFTQAYVPRKVSKPYFKIGLHGMTGFVNSDQKYYTPQMPKDSFDIYKAGNYGSFNILDMSFTIRDTAGLINYLFKTLLFDGQKSGQIRTPDRASTILGPDTTHLRLDNEVLKGLVQNHFIYQFLPPGIQDTLLQIMSSIPNFYTLPAGGNMNTIIAGVPQFEIGSLYGTELMLRFIPPMDLGEYVGKFAFWGVGVKHSISQYFYDEFENSPDYKKNGVDRENPAPFDLAAQFVYQGTHLKNKVGVTQSDLKADASIFSFNLHFSKSFKDLFDIYSGFAVNHINIESEFKYYLPVETQAQLGLLRVALLDPNDPNSAVIMPPEPPEYPGDTKPQTTSISLKDTNYQWTFGMRKAIGPVALFLDYSVSKFNVLSFGLEVVL